MTTFCRLSWILLVATASAAAHLDAQWKIDVVKDGTITATARALNGGDHFKFVEKTEELTIKCTNVSCTDVRVSASPAGPDRNRPSVVPKAHTVANDTIASFTVINARVAQTGRPVHLEISLKGTLIGSFGLDTLQDMYKPVDLSTEPVSLKDLLSSPACQRRDIDYPRGAFVVSPNGNVLSRPTAPVNEGQQVTVEVVADGRLVHQLLVKRSSPFRTVRISNILSGNVTVPTEVGGAAGREAKTSANARCEDETFELADFASGQATVEISALTDQGKQITGTFDFTVDELYTGAFILGGIWTSVRNAAFGKTTVRRDTVLAGAHQEIVDTVITETDRGGPRFLYSVTYTPFVWGERDVKAGVQHFYEHFNPAVGVAINDISKNAMVGVDFDMWNRIYVIYGLHIGRVTELDPRAKLALGSVIGSNPIPTRSAWRTGSFWGVGVDLQAGIDLFHSIVSGGTASTSKTP